MIGKTLITFLLVGLCIVYAKDTERKDGNITYPCATAATATDIEKCIRNYFVKSGSCVEAHHKDMEPIGDQSEIGFFPSINLTVVVTDAKVTFINPQVESFYINENTGNLVYAVQYDGIVMDSKYTYFQFHRPGQEPVLTGDYVNATYTVILTAIIPIRKGLTKEAMENASITAYHLNAYPKFDIGPNVVQTLNPVVVDSLMGLYLHIPIAIKEVFLTGAPHFFVLYVQHYNCDFGLPLNANTWGNTIHHY